MIKFFIKKSVVTICLNVSILLIGYFSLGDIANEFIPAVEVPAVGVVFPTTFLHHDDVVSGLVKKVESQLLSTGDVEKIETTLDRDRTIMFIFYKWSLTPEESLQRARQVVSSVKRPMGILEPIFVLHRPSMSPIYRVAFFGGSAGALTEKLGAFSSEMERLPGVAEVRLSGASPQEGRVLVSPENLASKGLSISDIIRTAKTKWSFRHLFGDEKADSKEDRPLQLIRYQLENINDLEQSLVYSGQDGQKATPLKWIATVSKQNKEPSVFVGDNKDAVILEVMKAPGTDAISIVESVQSRIKDIVGKESGLNFIEVYNEADKIKEAQAGVLQNFVVGVTLNSFVLIIFLGSIIGAVVASCVFPTAILGTLFIMKSMDISLNIFALNGFSLASGMITDASIVVLEAIMRRFQKGESLFASSFKGTKDVMLGVFASTLTTAAVIVPISIQSGVSSKLFSDLGIVLVATQFISLIAVFTFVPWICSKILSDDEARPKPVEVLYGGTTWLVSSMFNLSSKVLEMSLNSKMVRWGAPAAVTFLSVVMLFALPESEFLPKVAASVYSVKVPLNRMDMMSRGPEFVKKLSTTLGNEQSIDWVVTRSDSDGVNATFKSQDKEVSQKVESLIANEFGVSKSRVVIAPMGPAPSSEPLGFDGYYFLNSRLSPEKREILVEEFCKSPGIIECVTNSHYEEPKKLLKPSMIQMSQSGTNILEATLNVASLTQPLDMASIGGLSIKGPVSLSYDFLGNVVDFPLVLGKGERAIRSLGSLFSHEDKVGLNAQFRKNAQNYSPVYFRISGITIGQAVAAMNALGQKHNISSEKIVPMGTIETMEDTFGKMIQALILSAFLILLVLVIQFQSLSQALIIMYSIPLSVGGAVAGLLITGETLNVGVIVGFILLIGIIVNNGILLMDAINQRVESGMGYFESVLEAVESRTRPILMTTFSTILGMLPTLVLEAEGKELYQGMAIVNIFGMAFGTLLTLVIIPVVIRTVISYGENKKGAVAP